MKLFSGSLFPLMIGFLSSFQLDRSYGYTTHGIIYRPKKEAFAKLLFLDPLREKATQKNSSIGSIGIFYECSTSTNLAKNGSKV